MLPSETFLADQMAVADRRCDPRRAGGARAAIGAQLAPMHCATTYARLTDTGPYRIDGDSIGRRALRNTCLAYLAAGDPDGGATWPRRSSTPGGT